mmetsp:Transcript_18921/g.27834  ORF Transcript_18921/g.27834 Transcript_18921/m.27834 type:complete len:109 (-) Transcript_18921:455-781(-)
MPEWKHQFEAYEHDSSGPHIQHQLLRHLLLGPNDFFFALPSPPFPTIVPVAALLFTLAGSDPIRLVGFEGLCLVADCNICLQADGVLEEDTNFCLVTIWDDAFNLLGD